MQTLTGLTILAGCLVPTTAFLEVRPLGQAFSIQAQRYDNQAADGYRYTKHTLPRDIGQRIKPHEVGKSAAWLQSLPPRLRLCSARSFIVHKFVPLQPANPTLALPSKPPETNAQKILIDALPTKNPVLHDLASQLASITSEGSGNIRSIDAKGSKGIKGWGQAVKVQRVASALLASKGEQLLQGIRAADRAEGEAVLQSVQTAINKLGDATQAEDRTAAVQAQVAALRGLDELGSLEVSKAPSEIPEEYKGIPRLLGRAEVEITVRSGKTRKTSNMIAVLDGFSAPLTAGHFLDLVEKKAFDRVPIAGQDESSVTFAADASKAPKRQIPLEILAEGDEVPSYGETLEEQGRMRDKVVLPFNSYGTIALGHPTDNVNGGGDAAFFLKADPSYTPAGLNTLDGNYAVFGYVIEGQQALDDLDQGDPIESIRILSGRNNLQRS